jgi:hypothetical protein
MCSSTECYACHGIEVASRYNFSTGKDKDFSPRHRICISPGASQSVPELLLINYIFDVPDLIIVLLYLTCLVFAVFTPAVMENVAFWDITLLIF